MINSEYYKKYQGPELIKCMCNNEDITQKIKYFNKNNNWSILYGHIKKYLVKIQVVKILDVILKVNFCRIYWFHGFIH